MEKSFNKYMEETHITNRWKIFIVGLIGAFAGACLMFIMCMLGFSA